MWWGGSQGGACALQWFEGGSLSRAYAGAEGSWCLARVGRVGKNLACPELGGTRGSLCPASVVPMRGLRGSLCLVSTVLGKPHSPGGVEGGGAGRALPGIPLLPHLSPALPGAHTRRGRKPERLPVH